MMNCKNRSTYKILMRLLAVGIFLTIIFPQPAHALFGAGDVVSDPITEIETTNTTVQSTITAGATVGLFTQSVLHWIDEHLEWQQLNGKLGNLHTDFRLLTHAMGKVTNGAAQAGVEASDRLFTGIPTATVAANANISPTSIVCQNVYGGAGSSEAKENAKSFLSIVNQIMNQSNTGKTAPGVAATNAYQMAQRTGKGWTFEDSLTTPVGTQAP